MRFLCLALAVSAASPVMADGATDRGLREISKCWGVGSASSAAMEAIIVLEVVFRADGSVESIVQASAYGASDAGISDAHEAAKRAVSRCGANGKAWADQVVHLEFNYRTMWLSALSVAPRDKRSFKPVEI